MESTKIGDCTVVMVKTQCMVSQGMYVATLDELRRGRQLRHGNKEAFISQHDVGQIHQWAKARGYVKERKRVG